MEEIYNVIELKKGSIEVINDHTLRINKIRWKFKSELYGGDEGSLKIIQKEEDLIRAILLVITYLFLAGLIKELYT